MCDATEIDEILALRILTLTDDEKRLARSTDPRAAAIVDRIEGFSPEVFASLHGEMRPRWGPTATAPDAALPWWEPAVAPPGGPRWDATRSRTDAVWIAAPRCGRGARSGLRPRPGADAQDLFLAGRRPPSRACSSMSTASEHVAVVLDDDPAADLFSGQGRFMYFHPDEVEPL